MLQKVIGRGGFYSEIKLTDPSEGMPTGSNPDVQVLRVGKFNHPKYGEFEITRAVLSEMKSNFDRKIRGIDISFDYFHNSDQEASGWPKALELREDGMELWAVNVEWTPRARKMLSEKEVKYFSPDFAFQWTDPESGVTYKNVLFGGGLTNRPFVKDMAAIVAAEGEEMDKKAFDELQAKVLKLAEDGGDLAKKHEALMKDHADLQQKHAALQKKLDDMGSDHGEESEGDSEDVKKSPEQLEKELAEAKKQLADYAEEKKKLQEEKKMAEKEKIFAVLLSEGKACAAQKDSYLNGDMEAFIKLAQSVNLEGKGNGGGSEEGKGADYEDRVLKLAEEKCKADPKLNKVQAITLAKKELK